MENKGGRSGGSHDSVRNRLDYSRDIKSLWFDWSMLLNTIPNMTKASSPLWNLDGSSCSMSVNDMAHFELSKRIQAHPPRVRIYGALRVI